MHPNIAELVEYFVSDEGVCCFFVLERLQTDLFTFIETQVKRLSDSGALSEQQARPIFRDVTSALAHMNSRNLSHNDVKPENVLLTIAAEGSIGRAKLGRSSASSLVHWLPVISTSLILPRSARGNSGGL